VGCLLEVAGRAGDDALHARYNSFCWRLWTVGSVCRRLADVPEMMRCVLGTTLSALGCGRWALFVGGCWMRRRRCAACEVLRLRVEALKFNCGRFLVTLPHPRGFLNTMPQSQFFTAGRSLDIPSTANRLVQLRYPH